MRGGRTQDLPRMKYKLIRGVLQLGGCLAMHKSRSKYGAIRHNCFNLIFSVIDIYFHFALK
jgi:ribosomal protein S12